MRIGRTLPPVAAPIGWKSLFLGIIAVPRGEAELDRFSGELKEYFDKSHCFLVSSGKAALTLILCALKEKYPERDEVIIPAYTCYSVPSAIVRAGLKVKLCDTSADNFDFDFMQLRLMLKSKRLLCVVPTHLFGLPADIEKLKGLIDDPEVTVVEDAAQAMGGEWQGEKLGTLSDIGFFSLGRGKAFSTVEGGVILVDCDELASRLKHQVDEASDYTLFEVTKLFIYVIALNILLHPCLFWIPKSLPFLKLGETVFCASFKIKKMSTFQAGLANNWVEKLRSLRQARYESTRRWLSIMDPGVLNLFVNEQTGIPDLIRYPVAIQDEQIRSDFLNVANKRGLGVAIAYPDAISAIPELADMFCKEVYPLAKKHSTQLVTLPVHHFLTKNDHELLASTFNSLALSKLDA